jgi:tripartite-type tricarboxylate transporter receptor subunit TctC
MKLRRRRFLRLAAGAVTLPAVSRLTRAEGYPSRPVRWIVCFAAGGPNDVTARLVGQYLSEYLGQNVVIENRVGAGGNVGMEIALNAPPDGYTIAFCGPNNAINATLYEKLPFDFIRDSVPVDRAGLRGERVVRDRGAARHAARHRRQAQWSGERGAGESQTAGAPA